jgi:hypothetical protein
MANKSSIFNVGILDDLHTYFPELLYNSGRFRNVQDVLSYIQEQAKSRFNLFDYGARQYAQTQTENLIIQPQASLIPPQASLIPPQASSHTQATPSQTQNACTCSACRAAALITPSRTTLRTTTVPPPLLSQPRTQSRTSNLLDIQYTFDNPLSEVESSAASALLSLFSMPMGQTLFNSMENVVVRPTQDQITNATSILTIGDISDSTCTVCQEQIDSDVPVRRINLCQHQFHKACIDRWFERSVFCPMCRQDIRDSRTQGGTGTTE